MSSYENAPATEMLSTNCAICSRPLVDAKSAEIGIGPVCRKKCGYDLEVTEANRIEANRLIHALALDLLGVVEGTTALRALGFETVAETIIRRKATIVIEVVGEGRISVSSPYDPDAVAEMRRIPGRRWDAERKVNTFPTTYKKPLWVLLQEYYPGAFALGPKGPFEIPAA